MRNGAVKLTQPLSQLKIPPTVQAILASRIDRLAPDHKELLQTLAVIGMEFQLGLVRKVLEVQSGTGVGVDALRTSAGRVHL